MPAVQVASESLGTGPASRSPRLLGDGSADNPVPGLLRRAGSHGLIPRRQRLRRHQHAWDARPWTCRRFCRTRTSCSAWPARIADGCCRYHERRASSAVFRLEALAGRIVRRSMVTGRLGLRRWTSSSPGMLSNNLRPPYAVIAGVLDLQLPYAISRTGPTAAYRRCLRGRARTSARMDSFHRWSDDRSCAPEMSAILGRLLGRRCPRSASGIAAISASSQTRSKPRGAGVGVLRSKRRAGQLDRGSAYDRTAPSRPGRTSR